MKRLVLIAVIVSAAVTAVLWHAPVHAELGPVVRIVLVQAAGADAKFERIDLHNLTGETVDLTGWKVVYKSASGGTTTPLIQLSTEPSWHVLLDAGKRETFVSKEFVAGSPFDSVMRSAEQFTGGMNHLGGGLQLLDSNGTVVDMVGWGAASETVRQGSAAVAMTSTTWLVRHGVVGNNAADFALEPQDTVTRPLAVGSLYDVQDVCANLADIQLTTPEAYVNTNGNCQPLDACGNIEGVQPRLPEGMELDAIGGCVVIDRCLNLEGVQEEVPAGFEMVGERLCDVSILVRKLLITELLPNPSGSDEGNEFIELYNADTEPAALKDYQLIVGDKLYALPVDRVIAAGTFLTLSDADLGLHLANTTGSAIWLVTIRNVEVADAPAYVNARDDVSWALINGIWKYTYAPTPGEANIAMDTLPCEAGYVRDEATGRCRKVDVLAAAAVLPCRDGQYRSEETGRCRTIPVTASLTPCKEGQYRSEETNRCRTLATLLTSTTKPCEDDQFRNPVTNRCKKIASSEEVALADCGEGRERNPTTNRCRNIVSVKAPEVAFAVEPVKDTAAAFAGWWALGGVGALAVGYAGWEWRREMLASLAKMREVFTLK
jgi:hypothetical protein